ncbi:hypothetical protein [Aquimarina sp. MAR_2010_214]|uniref:hypothetical protein n=1 Tax=Aquimarina sp. MAR_2010_214 TaxID=1250026 RepID=UPI000C6FD6CC|nr:hypothetical protein [Aquimarina sp. MAR_2010_214]
MNEKLIEAFDMVKNKVDTNRRSTSIHIDSTSISDNNYEVTHFKYLSIGKIINFKYVDTANEIHWTTLVKEDIGVPHIILKYTISYKKRTILFKKGSTVLKNSDLEYKSIVNTFISDALALKEHQEQVSKEIKNGEMVRLKIGETVQLKDGVSLSLTNFVTKRVYPGNPLYARAEVDIALDNTTKNIYFVSRSLHGVVYPLDGLTFDELKGYVFRLMKYRHGENIEVLVSKTQMD